MQGAPPIVVMGVAGSGKTTVGALIAARLGIEFVDGDSLHPEANVAKMAAGVPLTDEDRAPWLDLVAARLGSGSVVVACSALKRAYRDRLRAGAPGLTLVYLHGTADLLAERMAARHDHFMPTTLLDSQLATLEPPTPDEHAIPLDVAEHPEVLADSAVRSIEEPLTL